MNYLKKALIIVILILPITLSAQKPKLGIKGGINISNMITDADANENFRSGFHVGLISWMPITDRVALQPELLYTTKGTHFNFDDNALIDGKSKLKLSYIELPVKLSFNVTDKLALHAGPYAAYLLNAKLDSDVEILEFFDIASDEDVDRENFKDFDVGLDAGIGITLNPVIIDLDYKLGLNSITKTDEISYDMIGEARNQAFSVSVSFLL